MIARCTCRNEYQDRRYGRGRRVFTCNVRGEPGYCTACGLPYQRPAPIAAAPRSKGKPKGKKKGGKE
jgi:hypothetical protein